MFEARKKSKKIASYALLLMLSGTMSLSASMVELNNGVTLVPVESTTSNIEAVVNTEAIKSAVTTYEEAQSGSVITSSNEGSITSDTAKMNDVVEATLTAMQESVKGGIWQGRVTYASKTPQPEPVEGSGFMFNQFNGEYQSFIENMKIVAKMAGGELVVVQDREKELMNENSISSTSFLYKNFGYFYFTNIQKDITWQFCKHEINSELSRSCRTIEEITPNNSSTYRMRWVDSSRVEDHTTGQGISFYKEASNKIFNHECGLSALKNSSDPLCSYTISFPFYGKTEEVSLYQGSYFLYEKIYKDDLNMSFYLKTDDSLPFNIIAPSTLTLAPNISYTVEDEKVCHYEILIQE